MRLATWNVNSIRTRVDRVLAFLERESPTLVLYSFLALRKLLYCILCWWL